MLKKLLVLSLMLIGLSSCEDEEKQLLFQVVGPEAFEVYTLTGNSVDFHITAESSVQLKTLLISIRWEDGSSVFLDQYDLFGETYTHTYTLEVPEFTTGSFRLIFTVYDSEGFSETQVRTISDAGNIPLQETGPLSLYSLFSTSQNNGLVLSNLQLLNLAESPLIDVDIRENDNFADGIMNYSWTTDNQTEFFLDNNFDYENATQASIAEAITTEGIFEVSAEEGNIILLKYGGENTHYAVAKIVEVNDESEGSENDAYIFTIKK